MGKRCNAAVGSDVSEEENTKPLTVDRLDEPWVTSFSALARSPKHAAHLFGKSNFYLEQTQIGMGMV